MYHPIQPGIPKHQKHAVSYTEYLPAETSATVACYWRLYSYKRLQTDCTYLVLPDGCIDIVFDLNPHTDSHGAIVMTPALAAVKLNLGTNFSYIGIRLLPGSWLDEPAAIVGTQRILSKIGSIDAVQLQHQLATTAKRLSILEEVIQRLVGQGLLRENIFAKTAMRHTPGTVHELVELTGYSQRQLQRILQQTTGYTPHDFLKIIRFQRSLATKDVGNYADQSHYIREFKRLTGMTPGIFYSQYQ